MAPFFNGLLKAGLQQCYNLFEQSIHILRAERMSADRLTAIVLDRELPILSFQPRASTANLFQIEAQSVYAVKMGERATLIDIIGKPTELTSTTRANEKWI